MNAIGAIGYINKVSFYSNKNHKTQVQKLNNSKTQEIEPFVSKKEEQDFRYEEFKAIKKEIEEKWASDPYITEAGIVQEPKFDLIKAHNAHLAEKIFLDEEAQSIPTLQKDAWKILSTAKSERGAKNKALLLEVLLYDERFYTDEDFADFASYLLQKTSTDKQLQAAVKMAKSDAYTKDYRKSKNIAYHALAAFIANNGVAPGYTNYSPLVAQKAFSDKRIYEDLDLMRGLFIENRYRGIYLGLQSAQNTCQKLDQMLEN